MGAVSMRSHRGTSSSQMMYWSTSYLIQFRRYGFTIKNSRCRPLPWWILPEVIMRKRNGVEWCPTSQIKFSLNIYNHSWENGVSWYWWQWLFRLTRAMYRNSVSPIETVCRLDFVTRFRQDPICHLEIIAILNVRQFTFKMPIHALKQEVNGVHSSLI